MKCCKIQPSQSSRSNQQARPGKYVCVCISGEMPGLPHARRWFQVQQASASEMNCSLSSFQKKNFEGKLCTPWANNTLAKDLTTQNYWTSVGAKKLKKTGVCVCSTMRCFSLCTAPQYGAIPDMWHFLFATVCLGHRRWWWWCWKISAIYAVSGTLQHNCTHSLECQNEPQCNAVSLNVLLCSVSHSTLHFLYTGLTTRSIMGTDRGRQANQAIKWRRFPSQGWSTATAGGFISSRWLKFEEPPFSIFHFS